VVSLQLQDKRLQLKAGKSKFSLQTLPAQDFPKIVGGAQTGAEAKLTQKELKRLLALVQYAMAQQDIRYYLNGLLLSLREDALVVVATDGHRLALASLAINLGAARYPSDPVQRFVGSRCRQAVPDRNRSRDPGCL